MAEKEGTLTAKGPVSNGAKAAIEQGIPYAVEVSLKGTTDLLFHRWNCEEIDQKANAAKGSKAKKTDNLESYVYRDEKGNICLPGEYVRQAVVTAAKFRQDPRSPRKSASDLFKAGIACDTILAPIGPEPKQDWAYVHRCRVQVQKNGITRSRPAFNAGWEAKVILNVLLPEYINPDSLHDVLVNAGRLIGVGDFRPSYGRFSVTSFKVLSQS